jgi:YegS/Rv2252/BmrU family lipid kinase
LPVSRPSSRIPASAPSLAEPGDTSRSLTNAAGAYAGRILVVVNPHAGQERPERVRRRLGAAFAAREASFDLVTTEHPGHAATLAREAVALGYGAVAVCGGDGTLAEVATGLAGSTTPLAVIPRGTGNQVARNLGIPLQLERAVDVAIHGREVAIDLGRIESRYFALVAGAGFDAAVMQAATRELKERWGFGAYIYAAVRESLSATPRRFRIVADGRDLEVDAVSVMVANAGELFTRWLPIRFPLTAQPSDAWHDGLLDVVIVAPRNPPDLAAILWQAANRKFSHSDRLIHFQTGSIRIDADPPIAVQVDGDPAGVPPIAMSAVRDAMRIKVPLL